MITDKSTNKPRGYAFVEYMHTRDMKGLLILVYVFTFELVGFRVLLISAFKHLTAAYKQADGRKIDGRRILVDVERGRTVPNWHPRRLGGGLGTTRVGSEDVIQRYFGAGYAYCNADV